MHFYCINNLFKKIYAVLDEATSSLSEGNEFYFYTTLSQLSITVLSIGHRSTLQKVLIAACIQVLMRDEKEGRKKQVRSNKQRGNTYV